jgi:hypothetical protein
MSGPIKVLKGLNPLNRQRFLEAGWCLKDYQMVVDDVFTDNNAIQFMLSSIDRPKDTRDHSACTLKECKFDIVLDRPYKHRHTETCNEQCTQTIFEGAYSSGLITKLIKADFTPLLGIAQRSSDGQHMTNVTTSHKLGVGERTSKLVHGPVVPYVAFSHVWFHGLGNPDRNSLPQCQLLHLQSLANQAVSPGGHPVPFWIDTICVPIEPKYRKLAIRAMSRVYREAKYVIVLDTSLLQVPSTLDPAELNMRIAITTWTHRLWTYQEASLADTLLFQFQDDFIEVNSLRQRYLDERKRFIASSGAYKSSSAYLETMLDWPSVDITWHDTLRSIKNISFATAYQEGFGEYNKLSFLNKALAVRSTTKAEDEALCLASILGQDVGKILDTRKQDGMKLVLLSLKTVPGTIIFCNRPRYTEKGHRWIPKSLLRDSIAITTNMVNTSARITPRGLLVTYPGIQGRLSPSPTPTPEPVKLSLITIAADDGELYLLKAPAQFFDANVAHMELVATETYGVIWDSLYSGKIVAGQEERVFRDEEELVAALVRVEKREEGVDFCVLLTNVYVCRVLGSRARRGAAPVANARGERMADIHVWCVG